MADSDDSYEFNVTDEQTFVTHSGLWLADSATQSHIVRDRALFTTYCETPEGKISGAGSCRALGRGTVPVVFKVDGRDVSVTLQDAIHAPEISSNLISMGRLTKAGFTFSGSGDNFFIKKGDRTIGCGRKFNNLYQLNVTPTALTAYVTKTRRTWYEWHCIMGHLNKAQLRDLKQHSVGMDVDESSDFEFMCEACIQAKQARRPFLKESVTEYRDVGELTVFNTWGPAQTESLHHNTYYISFTDAKSRNSVVSFMKSRASALDRFKKYKALHLEKSRAVCTGETSTDHSDLRIHLPDLYHPDQAARRLRRSIPVQIAAAVVYTNTYRDRTVGSHTIPTHTTMGSLYT